MRWLSVLAVVGGLVLAGCIRAEGGGYWRCVDGQWMAQDNPSHARPLRACGERPPTPKTEAACAERGGTWGPVGIFPVPLCRLPTRDAGNPCADNDECESACIAELDDSEWSALRAGKAVHKLGRCAPMSMVVGCHAFVAEGAVTEICLD